MLRRITYLLDGRLWEWTICLGLMGLAVEIFLWPTTMTVGAFKGVSKVMSAEGVGVYSFVVGSCAIVALFFNGKSFVLGPLVRSICAIARSVLWVQFAFALWTLSLEQEAPSAGLPFWAAFTISELYVAYRAALDVRRNI